jgi:amidohydrolase
VERALSIARLMGGDYDLNIQTGTPPMNNDPGVVQVMSGAAGDLLGAEHVLPPVNGLGAEDFGCFSDIAPGAMFSLGCKIEGDERYLHNPRFDIDERCLPVGAAILAETALRLAKQL